MWEVNEIFQERRKNNMLISIVWKCFCRSWFWNKDSVHKLGESTQFYLVRRLTQHVSELPLGKNTFQKKNPISIESREL